MPPLVFGTWSDFCVFTVAIVFAFYKPFGTIIIITRLSIFVTDRVEVRGGVTDLCTHLILLSGGDVFDVGGLTTLVNPSSAINERVRTVFYFP